MSASFGALLAAARSISVVIAKAVPFLKPYFAQRSAAAAPEAFVASHQAMFEMVFRRLQAADPHDSMFVRAYDGVVTKLITPEFLRTDNVQDWLGNPSVKAGLEDAAYALVQGRKPSQQVVARLESAFMEVGCASAQEAGPVVQALYTVLAANLNARIVDTGTAALVVAGNRESRQPKFDTVCPHFDRFLLGRQALAAVVARSV